MEGAIDYLSAGQLRKAKPTDVLEYIKTQGPTPLVEIQRVFDLASKDALSELERLEKLAKAKRSTLAGTNFWFG